MTFTYLLTMSSPLYLTFVEHWKRLLTLFFMVPARSSKSSKTRNCAWTRVVCRSWSGRAKKAPCTKRCSTAAARWRQTDIVNSVQVIRINRLCKLHFYFLFTQKSTYLCTSQMINNSFRCLKLNGSWYKSPNLFYSARNTHTSHPKG